MGTVSGLPATGLAGRDFLRISDLAAAEAEAILDLAAEMKLNPKEPLFPGATLGLYFAKHSTRTRVSFTVAMTHLGGSAVALTPEELQLSRGESLPDTARALSRYLDAIAVRTHEHAELEAWAEWATIPVINALTAEEHPCQALADALTIRARFGSLDGVRVAWVGDGSNVLVSLAALGRLLGYDVIAASPEGYEADGVETVRDPREAVAGADVVVTDTWISMGQEHERVKRLNDLEPYLVDPALRLLRRKRSSCTACRRMRARRSPRSSCTATARRSGTRRRTASTSRRRCRRCWLGV